MDCLKACCQSTVAARGSGDPFCHVVIWSAMLIPQILSQNTALSHPMTGFRNRSFSSDSYSLVYSGNFTPVKNQVGILKAI